MKTTTLTILLLLIFDCSYSQEFSFKKASLDGIVVKIPGEVSLSDTLVQISTNGTKSEYPVEVVLKKDEFIQYKLKTSSTGEIQIRFTFQPNIVNNKVEKYSLNIETKDGFTQKVSSVIYFLIPKG